MDHDEALGRAGPGCEAAGDRPQVVDATVRDRTTVQVTFEEPAGEGADVPDGVLSDTTAIEPYGEGGYSP